MRTKRILSVMWPLGMSVVGLATNRAVAEPVIAAPSDFATITNAEGKSRVLFHVPWGTLQPNSRIERATLLVSLSGPSTSKILTLQLHPVLTPWSAGSVTWDSGWDTPGGDIDPDIYTRAEFDLGNGVASFGIDVTHFMKEILEDGLAAEGILVTVPPYQGEGFDAADLSWVEGMASVVLDLDTRAYSPPPPYAHQDDASEAD